MSEILQKYLKRSLERSLQGIPLGDFCEYCATKGSRKPSKYQVGIDVCSNCGASMPNISFGFCYGIPINCLDDKMAILRVLTP